MHVLLAKGEWGGCEASRRMRIGGFISGGGGGRLMSINRSGGGAEMKTVERAAAGAGDCESSIVCSCWG